MSNEKEFLDHQLSQITWTRSDRNAVLCTIRKEKKCPMKKKLTMVLVAALLLAMISGVALAVSTGWGVLDFAQRDAQVYDSLSDVPVQTAIPQQGGQGREAAVTVTDAVWDGETVYITLLAQPVQEGVLLMDGVLSPDMPVGNLDRELSEGKTIAEWAAGHGFTDMLGLDITPYMNGDSPASAVSWHMEEGGACTQLIVFEGVTPGETLELTFVCTTFGSYAETESISAPDRADSFRLTCTLTAPKAE